MKRIWPGRSCAHSCGLRLLDLDDHVGLGEDLGRGRGDLGAGGAIGVVVGVDAGARAGLDQHLVAVGDIFADRAGRQADAGLAALDLLRNTDQHGILPEIRSMAI